MQNNTLPHIHTFNTITDCHASGSKSHQLVTIKKVLMDQTNSQASLKIKTYPCFYALCIPTPSAHSMDWLIDPQQLFYSKLIFVHSFTLYHLDKSLQSFLVITVIMDKHLHFFERIKGNYPRIGLTYSPTSSPSFSYSS